MALTLVNDDGYRWDKHGEDYEIIKAELTWNIIIPYLKSTNQDTKRSSDSFLSCFFNAKESPDHKWRMQVEDDISRLHITLLHFDSCKQATLIGHPAVVLKFVIVDSQKQKKFKRMFLSPAKSKSLEFRLLKDDIVNTKCQQNNGSLNFYCKIQSFVKKGKDIGNPEFSSAKPINLSDQLLTQIEGMLRNEKFSNVIFVLRGREFPAHKAILASRSEVFEAMFKHETNDRPSNRFVIEDIEPDVFQIFLRFMYTGKVSVYDIEKFAVGLYKAADIYLLDQLKIQCENHLIRRPMSAVFCIESLLFISNHPSAEKLKQEAIKFFRLYPLEVMETEGWRKAKNENKPWLSGFLKFLLHPADSAVQFPVKVVNEESSSKRKR